MTPLADSQYTLGDFHRIISNGPIPALPLSILQKNKNTH